jgi:hypothetical protein
MSLSEEERRAIRVETMRKVREKHYEKLTEEQKHAFRSKGGKSVKNRYKFNSQTGKKAAESRWEGDKI